MEQKLISRRHFMKRMAGASLLFPVPHIISRAVLGRGPFPAASDRITLAHIGVGGRGTSLMNSFIRIPGTQSVAVCDPFQEKREEAARVIERYQAEIRDRSAFTSCAAVNDFRELLDRKDIDAFVIATPDHWHVPIAIAACKAGKDIYVEKPLGVSVAENQAVRQAVLRHGTVFQYGTQQRSERNFRFACELVRNGRIGKLRTIHAWCPDMSEQSRDSNSPGGSILPVAVPRGFDYDLWLGPAPVTPYTLDRCTSYGSYHVYDNSLGFIAGWGAHPLDIAQWGNGTDLTSPVSYEGTGSIARQGLYDTVDTWDILCTYRSGVILRFMSAGIARPVVEPYHPSFNDHGTTFIGENGWVSVDRRNIYASPGDLLRSSIGADELHLYESLNHYGNFIECIRTRRETVSPAGAAVQSDIISHMGDILIRTGGKIEWDPDKEVFAGNRRFAGMLSRPMRSPWRLE